MPRAQLAPPLILALCLLATMPESTASDAEPIPPVDAIWRAQRLELSFRSAHTFYSCDILRNKIEAILSAVGAHERIDIDLPCRDGVFINNALAVIRLATPVEATPQNVAAATTYSPEQQLIARMKNVQLPSANDLERFSAEWRTVALHLERPVRLEAADCDLLRNLAAQVFPRLGVHVDGPALRCSSSSVVRVKPKMRVMALIAAPTLPVAHAAGKREAQ